ncbi:DUF3784 domain-containing protein [Bizionia sediminis]|uniref:DUF3784 domain-containing protein n=1 Tax=Bizionia sediminis TaxID=1737064 RepID=A0ABW5KPW2_9FLAO
MIITAIILSIVAYLIKSLKLYDLIAGYNTMSDDKKAQYNIEKIAVLYANTMYAMAIIIVLGYAGAKICNNMQIGSYTTLIAVGVGVPYMLIRANSKDYKNK